MTILYQLNGWPTERETIAPVAHLHALGQITLIYNYLEEQIGRIFSVCMPTDDDFSNRLFHKLGNRDRIDLLSAVISESTRNENWKSYALHLLLCFDICTQNRNILMHALLDEVQDDFINISKAASNEPSRLIRFSLQLSDLQTTASQMGQAFIFGANLENWLRKAGATPVSDPLPPLPEKPPRPNTLIPHPPEEARPGA